MQNRKRVKISQIFLSLEENLFVSEYQSSLAEFVQRGNYGDPTSQPVNAAQLSVLNDQLVESISTTFSYKNIYTVSGSGSEIDVWKNNGS